MSPFLLLKFCRAGRTLTLPIAMEIFFVVIVVSLWRVVLTAMFKLFHSMLHTFTGFV